MAKEMLINVSAGEECRIALLDDGKLDELYMERTSATSHVGNIYKGKVTNVEPSIQAAFVDFGIGRNGFLHISDLMPTYFGKKSGDRDYAEPVGRKLSRRDRPPIQQCLRKGDEIVVQIIKEGIGTKGPTLSTYLSIPGRVLVMMPGMSKMGISKKLEDEEERARLRKILDGLKPPKDCGFIIRTAGIGKSKAEIERDLKYLARLWEQLKKKIDKEKAPVELYTEGDLVTRTVRDVFTSDVEKIVIDDKETARKVKDFIKLAMPRTRNKVELYDDQVPLFHKYEIESEIEGIYSRRVPLPSGGSLVIDQTEAIVAIDVNSGKFRDHSDAETTAFKTDLEAADEIPRQLKLRDMGGVIICDFIDLRFDRHRRELEQRLHENLKKDRAKTRMLRMSHFGIIEMTRQRMRPSLKKSIYQECTACRAHGMVKTPESMSLDVMRKLHIACNDAAVVRIHLTVHPEVANFLQNRKRGDIAALEAKTSKRVFVNSDPLMAMDDLKFELYDSRDGYIYIAELGMALPAVQHNQRQGGDRDRERGGRDRHRNDRDRGGQHKAKHDRHHEESEAIDAEELFSDGEEAESPKPPRGKQMKAAPAKVVGPTIVTDGSEFEETGADDEATVVDVDDGDAELPGQAPNAFYDQNEERRFENGGGRRRRRRRGRRGRGGQGGQGEHRDAEGGEQGEARDRSEAGGQPEQRGEQRGDQRGDQRRDDRNRHQQGRHDQNRNDPNRRDQQRGGDQRRDDRNRQDNRGQRNDRGRDRGRDRRNDRNEQPAGAPQRQINPDIDYDDPEYDAPAPGNELTPDTSPEAQRKARDAAAAAKLGGGRRGRRGGRGRGRGGQAPANRPKVDLTGLPDDEELAREEAELLAQQARAKSGDAGPPGTDVQDVERDEEANSPILADAPEPIGATETESSADAVEETGKAQRSRSRASSRRKPPEQGPVVRTGSADKHLADDEPADLNPIFPVASFEDLDELPDYDDE